MCVRRIIHLTRIMRHPRTTRRLRAMYKVFYIYISSSSSSSSSHPLFKHDVMSTAKQLGSTMPFVIADKLFSVLRPSKFT